MIMNILNNKVYIGSSKNIYLRKQQHYNSLRKGNHYSTHLQKAWLKYKEENFIFVGIEEVLDIENLIEREIYWIKEKEACNPKKGYNLGIPKKIENVVLREETIEKLRIATYNQYHKDKGRITLEEFLKGKRARDLIIRGEVTQPEMVYVFNKVTGDREYSFNSISETSKFFNTNYKHMSRYCNNSNLSYKGYIFIKVKDYQEGISYKKQHKEKKVYIKKGVFKGNPIETFNRETNQTIERFDNKIVMAEKLGTSVKYICKVLYGEKPHYKNMGIRLIKSL